MDYIIPNKNLGDYRFKVRASALCNFMKSGRCKADVFGDAARAVIQERALFDVWGFIKPVENKFINKGLTLENDAIELVANTYFLDNVAKNEVRITDDWFTGECDILLDDEIRDTKCVYSLASFVFNKEQALNKAVQAGYDLQGQVYMHLYDRPKFTVDFVLLPTPLDQLKYSDEQSIQMLHDLPRKMPSDKRITSITFERDKDFIEKVKERVELAQEIYLDYIKSMI